MLNKNEFRCRCNVLVISLFGVNTAVHARLSVNKTKMFSTCTKLLCQTLVCKKVFDILLLCVKHTITAFSLRVMYVCQIAIPKAVLGRPYCMCSIRIFHFIQGLRVYFQIHVCDVTSRLAGQILTHVFEGSAFERLGTCLLNNTRYVPGLVLNLQQHCRHSLEPRTNMSHCHSASTSW